MSTSPSKSNEESPIPWPIFLVGMPGSGKSTIGRELSEALKWPLFDTDALIAQQAGQTIPALFEAEGETAFRQLEAEVLRKLPLERRAIVATGGGLPCHHQNMVWLKSHGHAIYLRTDLHTLVRRIRQQPVRPLFHHLHTDEALLQHLALMLATRQRNYEQAHLIWDSHQPTEALLEKLTDVA